MAVFTMRTHSSPVISVIIPSRDGKCGGNVNRLLDALGRQEQIEQAEVLLVVGERPNGHARNVGAAASRGRHLVFIDDDAVLLGDRALASLLAPFDGAAAGEAPIGLTGSATLLPEDANRFQRWQGKTMPRTVFPPVDRITDTDMAHHLCCALPRLVYEEIGGESDVLETGTDVDLRNRLRGRGYRVVVVPGAVAAHPPPATFRAFLRKHFWYGKGKVELDRLAPSPGRDRIRGGPLAVLAYVLMAMATVPLRLFRLDRSSPWRFNPLLALADLARKLGYAQAYWRHLRGLSPAAPGLRSSKGLERWLRPSRVERAEAPPPGEVRRLLVVATAGLGDALTLLPALTAVRRHFAGARITAWVARPGAGQALLRRGVVDRVKCRSLAAPTWLGRVATKLATVLWLRRGRYDLAIANFINSNEETAVLLRLGGVPRRAGYVDDPALPSLYNLPVLRPPIASARLSVDRHLDLLPALGVSPPADGAPRWPVPPAARAAADRLMAARGSLGHAPRVGIHAGCGADMLWKRWPEERFADLADRLAADGLEVMLFGGPDETGLAAHISGRMRHRAIDLSGIADLDLTAALIAACDLFVSNDSGLYNLALCIPVPVVTLFGPSLPQISGPWETGRLVRLLTHKVACHPCYDYREHPTDVPCPIGRACLTGVGVDAVLAACRAGLRAAVTATPCDSPSAGFLSSSVAPPGGLG